jgi:hypothetical protein
MGEDVAIEAQPARQQVRDQHEQQQIEHRPDQAVGVQTPQDIVPTDGQVAHGLPNIAQRASALSARGTDRV